MLSKQFSVLLTALDLADLEKILRSDGDTQFLSDDALEDLSGLYPLSSLAIPISLAGKVSLFCYLSPMNMPQEILIRKISPVKNEIDLQYSNLIEFWRPFYNLNSIRPGRLFYGKSIYRDNKTVERDAKFLKWADHIMIRIKRILIYDRNRKTYMGHEAMKLVTSRTLKVLSL